MTRSSHPASDWAPVHLPRAVTRTIQAASGHRYRISLSVPQTPAPPGGFPSMMVLDAGALFATVAETERRLALRTEVTGVEPTVIIGVGHDGDDLYDPVQRHRDFTPGPAANERAMDRYETGGAAQMLDVLTGEVVPLIGGEVALNPIRRSLFGHSLAGYFALYAMTTRPEAFAAYAAISPSIWWDPERLAHGLDTMADATPALFLAAGALEEVAGDSPRAKRRMVGALKDFSDAAAGRVQRLQCTIFPSENHASVVGVAATAFLRFASANPTPAA